MDWHAAPGVGTKTNVKLWTTYWWSWAVMTQFANLNWQALKSGLPGPPNQGVTTTELQNLARLARLQRSDALGEILAQNNETISYFCDLLAITPVSHPATHRVIAAMSLISTFVVIDAKNYFQRPRPVQLMPMLLPPVVAGHPSYPSGHSTQSHLIVNYLENKVILGAPYAELRGAARRLARRIAHNREIAGLHYKTDSVDGETLATDIYNLLAADSVLPQATPPTPAPAGSQKVPALHDVVTEAKNEWP
jgi:hypothetical protein